MWKQEFFQLHVCFVSWCLCVAYWSATVPSCFVVFSNRWVNTKRGAEWPECCAFFAACLAFPGGSGSVLVAAALNSVTITICMRKSVQVYRRIYMSILANNKMCNISQLLRTPQSMQSCGKPCSCLSCSCACNAHRLCAPRPVASPPKKRRLAVNHATLQFC